MTDPISAEERWRLRWQVGLRSKRKLFCRCPILPRALQRRPEWQVSEYVEARSPVFVQGSPGWQQYSPPSETNAMRMLRVHWHPSLVCSTAHTDCAMGQQTHHSICPEALDTSLAVASTMACQRPQHTLIVRRPAPKSLSISGYIRGMLIGRGGRVSGDKGPIGISSLALEETLGTIVRRHQPPGAPCEWVDVVPGGAPALTWTTDWLPATSADALGTWLASFHQALLTTGLFASHNPRLAIDIQTPGQPTRTLTGFANPDQWPQYKAMAQKETTTKQPRATTHKHAEVWYWDKQHNVALWGWMPPPPYEVEGLCPLPTDEVAREEPLSRTYAQPYTNAARHIGAKEPTEDHELTIHWGWREKWEMRGQLSQDVIDGLITTGRVPLFEQMHALNPKHPPQVWGELLVRWPRGLQRKGCPIQHLSDERWMSIAALHGMGLCQREGLRDLLAFAAYFPDQPVRDLLRHKMGIAPLPPAKLKKQLPQLIAGPLPRATLWPARERFWMGRLMSQLKGAVPGKTVRKELYRLFSTQPPTPMDRCPFPPPSKKRKRS